MAHIDGRRIYSTDNVQRVVERSCHLSCPGFQEIVRTLSEGAGGEVANAMLAEGCQTCASSSSTS